KMTSTSHERVSIPWKNPCDAPAGRWCSIIIPARDTGSASRTSPMLMLKRPHIWPASARWSSCEQTLRVINAAVIGQLLAYMEGKSTAEQSLSRCSWSTSDPLYVAYRDEEWGTPVHDDRTLFEFLILEGAQAG